MSVFSPMLGAVPISATASSANGGFTFPVGGNAMHICNTSTTLYVTVSMGETAQTASLGTTGITLPPMGHIVVEANPRIAFVAAIASAAGPAVVIFTPGRVLP